MGNGCIHPRIGRQSNSEKMCKEKEKIGACKDMVRNTVGYILGIALIGSILAFAVSMLLNVLLYVAVGFVILLPLWGAYRRRKNWTHDELGLKRWLSGFRKVFIFGKPSLTFYLVLSIVIGFTYEQIIVTAVYVVEGLIFMLVSWESVRYVVMKIRKVEVLSFADALKSIW